MERNDRIQKKETGKIREDWKQKIGKGRLEQRKLERICRLEKKKNGKNRLDIEKRNWKEKTRKKREDWKEKTPERRIEKKSGKRKQEKEHSHFFSVENLSKSYKTCTNRFSMKNLAKIV